eukprot:4961598-Prymnesium_polylepis.2
MCECAPGETKSVCLGNDSPERDLAPVCAARLCRCRQRLWSRSLRERHTGTRLARIERDVADVPRSGLGAERMGALTPACASGPGSAARRAIRESGDRRREMIEMMICARTFVVSEIERTAAARLQGECKIALVYR